MIPGFNCHDCVYRLYIVINNTYQQTGPKYKATLVMKNPQKVVMCFLEIPGNKGSKQKLKQEVPTLQGTNISHLGKIENNLQKWLLMASSPGG